MRGYDGTEPDAANNSVDHIHVVAAALIDQDGHVLLTQRHADSHQGGLWEFPGGKLEAGETPEVGLRRELREELGIEVGEVRPLIRIRHRYPDRNILLDVYRVSAWAGVPEGLEGQPTEWAPIDRLSDYPMPEADGPVVSALRLPSRYLITPPNVSDQALFLTQLGQALTAGIGLVQLRVFGLPDAAASKLGEAAVERCHASGARLLVNGSRAFAEDIGADGLHLDSRRLQAARGRPLGATHLVAASCHTPSDLDKAAQIGADFALLSPVLPTRSHPDADPLGWSRFADWVDNARLPVFALGGMQPDLEETAWSHGAQGIAGIRGLWPEAGV